jgi:hypothetical protein
MFRAAANGLDRGPHVFGRVQQIPACHFELLGINPAAFIDTLRFTSRVISQGLAPGYVSVAPNHTVRGASVESFLGIECAWMPPKTTNAPRCSGAARAHTLEERSPYEYLC